MTGSETPSTDTTTRTANRSSGSGRCDTSDNLQMEITLADEL